MASLYQNPTTLPTPEQSTTNQTTTTTTTKILPFTPFALLTTHNRLGHLIILPTPLAITLPHYRTLYSTLHASPEFCTMAFSHHFAPQKWNDEETYHVIQTRDIERCWDRRGMGDFAVGLLKSDDRRLENSNLNSIDVCVEGRGRILEGVEGVRIFEGEEYDILVGNDPTKFLNDGIEWIGYTGIRDAINTSMPDRLPSDPELPPWQEMIEVRYGIAQEYWGKGIVRVAAEVVMGWAVVERRVRRFIAETERENAGSARVLEKLGFGRRVGCEYWKEVSEVEWERVVG